jgi:hypothetical protein
VKHKLHNNYMQLPEKLVASAQRTEEMWRQARGESAWVTPQTIEKKTASGT